MNTNIEKYKEDLNNLQKKGDQLKKAMYFECYPKESKKEFGDKFEEITKKLPHFNSEYQSWYSESKVLIKQLLPDRLSDFTRLYEKPKSRKQIDYENYVIEDYLQKLIIRRWNEEVVVGPKAAIPLFLQQLAILNSISGRFESSLFDIQQIVQADLLDSELSSAQLLLDNGFIRASGAIVGVILEKHLSQVIINHNITTRKKHPTINDFNELLKNNGILDIPLWRQIQRLGDIRNLCDHNKDREPTKDEVQELINGADKITKTLF